MPFKDGFKKREYAKKYREASQTEGAPPREKNYKSREDSKNATLKRLRSLPEDEGAVNWLFDLLKDHKK